MKKKFEDALNSIHAGEAIGKAGEIAGEKLGKAGQTINKFGSNFEFRADDDAEEVKTITGKFLGGANTRIGTKIVKFARFLELSSLITAFIGILAIVIGLIAVVFNVIVGEFWAVGISFIAVGAGIVVIFMAGIEIATTWALYGFGQVVNDVQTIRRNTEDGFGGAAVDRNPDNLPEL